MAWRDDTLNKLAKWMDIRHGLTAVDVGCGLGYLGYTYWKFFGEGGHYIGVDTNQGNLKDAAHASRKWATGGRADFVTGSAYALPIPDNSIDWVMCQVVLIHLEDPQHALAEMVRILKPGGLIMCKEPDNMSSSIVQHFNSSRELTIDERLLSIKIALVANKGRIARGQGDNSLGPKVPHMLAELGMTDIDIRLNDKVHFLEPPYDSPAQQVALENVSRQWSNKTRRETWIKREKEEFIAGGGSAEEYARMEGIADEFFDDYKQQIEDRVFYACGGGLLYVIKSRKPA
jgi:SAM-dependent methyltransferase